MLLMQFIAQDLSQEEKDKGVGCNQKNASANDFVPQDWTGEYMSKCMQNFFSLKIDIFC